MLLSTQTGKTMFRLGFEKGTKLLMEAGYDCLDMTLTRMINDDNEWNVPDWRDLAMRRREWAEKNGVKFNQAHAPFQFKWAEPGIREIADERINNSIEIAAILGAETIIVHPLHWFPYKGYEAEARQMNLDYYRSLIPLAEKCNIKVCLENMWQKEVKRKCISDDVASHAADHASYIDEIGSPYIVACLDVGHTALVGDEPEDAIRILGHDRLQALHIHDNGYTGDDHTLPGLGKLNWDAIMQALKDINYTGVFTYEADGFLGHFADDYLPEATRFMAQTGRYLLSKLN